MDEAVARGPGAGPTGRRRPAVARLRLVRLVRLLRRAGRRLRPRRSRDLIGAGDDRHHAPAVQAPSPGLDRDRATDAPRRRRSTDSARRPSRPPGASRRPSLERERRAAPRRGRRAQPHRPGDGAVGVVGDRPAGDRLAVVLLQAPAHLGRASARSPCSSSLRIDYRRWRRFAAAVPRAPRVLALVARPVPGVGVTRQRLERAGSASAPSPSSRRSSPSSPCSCSSPTCSPGGATGSHDTRRHAPPRPRRVRPAGRARHAPAQPRHDDRHGRDRVRDAVRRRRARACRWPRYGLAGAARGRGARHRRGLPAAPAPRLPRPVGRPAATPATRRSSRRWASRRAGWSASASARAGPSGASCPTPTPTSSSPSSARSSVWSAPARSSALFVALGFLGIRTAVTRADPFGRLLAAGITAWICVQAFVNIGAVIGILPDHRRPAAVRLLRRLVAGGDDGGGRPAPEHRPHGTAMTDAAGSRRASMGDRSPAVARPATCSRVWPSPGRSSSGAIRRRRSTSSAASAGSSASWCPRPASRSPLLPGRGIQRRLTLANVARRRRPGAGRRPGDRADRAGAGPGSSSPSVATPACPCAVAAVLWRVPIVVAEQNARAGRGQPARRPVRQGRRGVLPRHRSAAGGRHRQPGAARGAGRRPRPRPRRGPGRSSASSPDGRVGARCSAARSARCASTGPCSERSARWGDRGDLAIRHVVGDRDWAIVQAERPTSPPAASSTSRCATRTTWPAPWPRPTSPCAVPARAPASSWRSSACRRCSCRCRTSPATTRRPTPACSRPSRRRGRRPRRRARRRPPGRRGRRPARRARPARAGCDRRAAVPSPGPTRPSGSPTWSRSTPVPEPIQVDLSAAHAGSTSSASAARDERHRHACSRRWATGCPAATSRSRPASSGCGPRASPCASATTGEPGRRRRARRRVDRDSRATTPRCVAAGERGIPVLRRAEILAAIAATRRSRRGRRHPRQDDDVVDARAGAGRGRAAAVVHRRRRGQRDRQRRGVGRRRVVRGRGRRERRHVPRARRRGRRRHQRRARPPRALRRLRRRSRPVRPLPRRGVRDRRRRASTTRAPPGSRRSAARSPTARRPAPTTASSTCAADRAGVRFTRRARRRRPSAGQPAGARRCTTPATPPAPWPWRSSSACRSTTAAAALARYAGVARRFEFRGEAARRHLRRRLRPPADRGGRRRSAPPARAGGGGSSASSSRTATAAPAPCGRDFADAFGDADVLVVTDVYAAGEAPEPGRHRQARRRRGARRPPLAAGGVAAAPARPRAPTSPTELRPGDLCLTLGAGDLTTAARRGARTRLAAVERAAA